MVGYIVKAGDILQGRPSEAVRQVESSAARSEARIKRGPPRKAYPTRSTQQRVTAFGRRADILECGSPAAAFADSTVLPKLEFGHDGLHRKSGSRAPALQIGYTGLLAGDGKAAGLADSPRATGAADR
jgi:hypothetical protein